MKPVLDISFDKNTNDLLSQKILILEPGSFRVGKFNDLSLDHYSGDKTGMKIYKSLWLKNPSKCIVSISRHSLMLYSISNYRVLDTLDLKEDIKEFKYDEKKKLLYVLTCKDSNSGRDGNDLIRSSSRRRGSLRKVYRTQNDDLKGITEVFSSRRSIMKTKVMIERQSKFSTPGRGRSRKNSNRMIEKNIPKFSIKIFKISENEEKFFEKDIGSYPLSEEFEFTTFDISSKESILVATGYKKILKNEGSSRSKQDRRSKSKINVDRLAMYKGNKSLNVKKFSRKKSYYNALFLYKISEENGKLCYKSGMDILFDDYDNSGQVNYIKIEENGKKEGALNILTATSQGLNIFGFELLVNQSRFNRIFIHQNLKSGNFFFLKNQI